MLVAALTVALYGLYVLTHASLDVFPEFSPSQVVVQTEAPGLSAEMVERQVSQVIENSLMGTPGLESLRSQSIPGLSVVTVLLREGSSVYRNRQLVAERLAPIAGQFPAGIAPPVIAPLTSSASTVLGLGVTSERRSLMDLRTLVDRVLRPHLLAVEGVAEVNVFGGEVRQWQIQPNPGALLARGLTVRDLLEATRAASALRSAGFLRSANQHIIINAEAQPASVRELAGLALPQAPGLRLSDVARVVEAPAASLSAAAIDAKPGVFLMVQGQLGSNTRAVTLHLEDALEELRPLLSAEGVTLHSRLFRPANFIETAVANVQRDLLLGSALVVVVLFLFLFNYRTALICATAIPTSLLGAVLVLDRFGVSLNIMVLGGLAIALGEVVDDAIIDTENIFRRLRLNRAQPAPRSGLDVVLDASVEVRSSVVYATFIVALVFVPLLTMPGVAGKLFAPLGLAYISAILASLVVAITLTPALCLLLLSSGSLQVEDPPLVRWLKPRYLSLLRRIERAPGKVVSVVFTVVAAGVCLLPLFSGEFIPALKEGHYIIHMTAVPGTAEAESLRVGQRVARAIGAIPGVRSVAQWVGRAPNGADTFGPHYSEFEVDIGELPGREQVRILARIRDVLGGEAGGGFPGVAFAVNTFLTERIEETISGFAAPVAVSLFGPSLDLLDRDVKQVARALGAVPGARDVQVQAPPGTPELTIRLRPERAAALGITPLEMVESVQAAYEGVAVGQIYEGSHAVSVVVILDAALRERLSEVGQLRLRAPGGRQVELAEVADIAMTSGRHKILHQGARRMQSVTASVVGRDLGQFEQGLRARLAQLKLSPGTFVSLGGTAAAQAQARSDLLAHSCIAGVGILLLLYVAFGNLRNLGITLLNLPFALVGGVCAVFLEGGWLSLGSLVGFVTLFGITLRNSIMLVSHYQHLVADEGLPWDAATALRGAAERLPSILMTALVTALGLLPLALGSGEPGREIEGPMATIIVGGLATSTLLNLLVLPTVLLHFGRFRAFPGGAGRSRAPSTAQQGPDPGHG